MTVTSMISRLLAAAALLAAITTVATPRADAQPTAPPDFVSLADVDPTILLDIRYFTQHNFTGDPVDGYLADKSGHTRGSTMDLTLVPMPAEETRPYQPGEPLIDCTAPQPLRFGDNSLDMGTGCDCFDTLAHTLDPRVQGDQLKNRLLLKHGLEKQGLVNYENEWWHYTFKPEVYPDTYFDFPVDASSLQAP